MHSSSLPSSGGVPWFVVLPDCDDARPIAGRLRDAAAGIREIRHRSDRPWILGNWSDDEVHSDDVDSTRITAIGEHGLDRDRLRVPGEQDAGCAHWVTSRDGMVSVRGTVSGLRRVFHARIGGVRVAADRADVLAGLAGSQVDEVRLATRLVNFLPWPVSWRPVWRDVEAVFPGHDLELDHRGGWRERRYWSSPAATRTLAAGAQALRSALTAAVDLRVRDAEVVACDLSGLDSTSLCSLAVRSARRVVAATGASPDVMDDDVEWARLSAGELGIDHDVLPWEDTPLTYDGILDADDRFDEPCIMLANRARILRLADHATANGARIRLAGIGGDEMLDTAPVWLHSLARSNPLAAWRIARGYRAKYRWPWRNLVTAMADGRSYRHSLRWAARHMSTDIDENTPLLGWGVPLLLAPWVTAEARHTIRKALLEAEETAEPLAQNRGLHNTLGFIHAGTTIARQFQQMAARRGVRLALPYFDDAVMNASLSVRPEQRLNPRRYKPLAVEAMRGIVPARTLTRTTKSETSTTIALGLERHRDQILGLAEGSLLAERGLIDPVRMRDLCSRGFSWPVVRTLDSTIACEMWLRTTLTTTVAST